MKLFLVCTLALILSSCSSVAGFFKEDKAVLAAKIAVAEYIHNSDDACAAATDVSGVTDSARSIVNNGATPVEFIDIKLGALINRTNLSVVSKQLLLELASDTVEEHFKMVQAGEADPADMISINKLLDEFSLIADIYREDC